jgi:hypothetical protein
MGLFASYLSTVAFSCETDNENLGTNYTCGGSWLADRVFVTLKLSSLQDTYVE